MLINTWWYILLSLLVGFKAKVATKFDIQYIFFITNNFPYCNKNSTGTTSNNLKGIQIKKYVRAFVKNYLFHNTS